MTDTTIELYFKTGCSSCLRTREFLEARNVEFVGHNVLEDPDAMKRLTALELTSVPVVIAGDRWAHGIQLDDVAALLGFAMSSEDPLLPPDLWAKLELVVTTATGLIEQVPDDELDFHLPERPRGAADLAYHIFLIADGFVRAVDGDGGLASPTSISHPAPAHLRSARALADHARQVSRRLADWWPSQDLATYDATVETYYGPQVKRALLERTAWHSAQHTRQLALYLERMGIAPRDPLRDEDLVGLPLPTSVWG